MRSGQLMSPTPLILTVTCSAIPRSVGMKIEISPGVRVPFRAMSDPFLFGASCFSSFTTSDVFLLCNRLQMLRVDAATDATQMVQLKFRWNRPLDHFVSHPVCQLPFSFYGHYSITIISNRSGPSPTSRLGDWDGASEHCLDARALKNDGFWRLTPQIIFSGARYATVISHIAFGNMTVRTRDPRKVLRRPKFDRFTARDNGAVIWDVNKSHEIGSFDQVVRDRKALKHLVVPTYTAVMV